MFSSLGAQWIPDDFCAKTTPFSIFDPHFGHCIYTSNIRPNQGSTLYNYCEQTHPNYSYRWFCSPRYYKKRHEKMGIHHSCLLESRPSMFSLASTSAVAISFVANAGVAIVKHITRTNPKAINLFLITSPFNQSSVLFVNYLFTLQQPLLFPSNPLTPSLPVNNYYGERRQIRTPNSRKFRCLPQFLYLENCLTPKMQQAIDIP